MACTGCILSSFSSIPFDLWSLAAVPINETRPEEIYDHERVRVREMFSHFSYTLLQLCCCFASTAAMPAMHTLPV